MSELEQKVSAALDAIEQDGHIPVQLNVGYLAFMELFGAGACEGDGCTTFRDIPVHVFRRGANPHHWEFKVLVPGQAEDDLPTPVDNLPLPGDDDFSRLSDRTRRLAWLAILFGLALASVTVAGVLGAFR